MSKALNKKLPLISICVPVLNEEDNIFFFYEKISPMLAKLEENYRFEIIFTDNNSQDTTWQKIEMLSKSTRNVRAYRFTKNIGFQQSILFNLKSARGDAAIQVDVDLQDPIEIIEIFIEHWSQGYKIVYGERISRKENILMRSFRTLGYKLINKLSEDDIPKNVGDFRLIDREILEILHQIKTPSPYLRGFIASLGYNAKNIPYERDLRIHGTSNFNVAKIVKLGFSGLLNHSRIVSKITGAVTVGSFVVSFGLAVFLVVNRLSSTTVLPGWTFIAVIVLLGISINSLFSWLLNHYIHLIYRITSGEPSSVIEYEIK